MMPINYPWIFLCSCVALFNLIIFAMFGAHFLAVNGGNLIANANHCIDTARKQQQQDTKKIFWSRVSSSSWRNLSSSPRSSESSSQILHWFKGVVQKLKPRADTASDHKINPIRQYFNDRLFGRETKRKNTSPYVQYQLNNAVAQGSAAVVQIRGKVGTLDGYFYRGDPAKPLRKVVLFLSGSGAPAEEYSFDIAEEYIHHGIDVLAVNYRGYGKSDGTPSEKGLYDDAQAMLNYLIYEKKIAPENVLIHGYSLGAPVGAHLAQSASSNGINLGGLLLDRPMPSMSKAVWAHNIPAEKIVGQIAKKMNGLFSVKDNIRGLPKQTSLMLISDKEKMGAEGEKLRAWLSAEGYEVSGTRTPFNHKNSRNVMHHNISHILEKFGL